MTTPHITITENLWLNAEYAMGMSPWQIANKAIEIALAEQANEQPLITVEEARKLGAGKAEWKSSSYMGWHICGEDFQYFSAGVQYRAIKPEPVQPTIDVSKVYPEWEHGASPFKDWCAQWFGTDSDETYLAKAVLSLPTKRVQPVEPHVELKANLVKLDDELMTREAAAAAWKSKIETHVMWFKLNNIDWTDVIGLPIDYSKYFMGSVDCEYQLRAKPTVKLAIDDEPAKMLTPEQCEAERLARVDTHDLQSLGGIFQSWTQIGDSHWLPLDAKDHRDDQVQYRLVPKPLKQVSLDPAIREGVIALLNELGVTK